MWITLTLILILTFLLGITALTLGSFFVKENRRTPPAGKYRSRLVAKGPFPELGSPPENHTPRTPNIEKTTVESLLEELGEGRHKIGNMHIATTSLRQLDREPPGIRKT